MAIEMISNIIWLIPLPPLLAFFLILLFTRRNHALSHTIGLGAAFLSWLGAMLVFVSALPAGTNEECAVTAL